MFRINSHTLTSQASSEKVSYIIQRKIKDKAITAGIVGGILFFIVAIILAVCTVKCVNKRNKRRRREQENGISSYNIFHHQYVDTNDFAKKKTFKSFCFINEWEHFTHSLLFLHDSTYV